MTRRRVGLLTFVAIAVIVGVALAWLSGDALAATATAVGALALALHGRDMWFDRSDLNVTVSAGMPAGDVFIHAVNRGRRPMEIAALAFTTEKGKVERVGPIDGIRGRLEEKAFVDVQLSPAMVKMYWAPFGLPSWVCLIDSEQKRHWTQLPPDVINLLRPAYAVAA